MTTTYMFYGQKDKKLLKKQKNEFIYRFDKVHNCSYMSCTFLAYGKSFPLTLRLD